MSSDKRRLDYMGQRKRPKNASHVGGGSGSIADANYGHRQDISRSCGVPKSCFIVAGVTAKYVVSCNAEHTP